MPSREPARDAASGGGANARPCSAASRGADPKSTSGPYRSASTASPSMSARRNRVFDEREPPAGLLRIEHEPGAKTPEIQRLPVLGAENVCSHAPP
jgi:hypothetical protein